MRTLTIDGPDGKCSVSSRRLLDRTLDGRARLKLARANLRQADLRGLDFTGADLREADLRHTRVGVPWRWQAALAIAALAVSILIGFATGRAGHFLHRLIVSDEPMRRGLGALMAAELAVFLAAAVCKGLSFASRQVLPPMLALFGTASVVGLVSGGSGVGGAVMLVFSLLVGALLCAGALARAVAGSTARLLFVLVALCGALAARSVGGGIVAIAIAVTTMFVGRRSLAGAGRSPMLTELTLAIACARGTSFLGADLRGAHLDGAQVRCCDFRGAQLEGVDFGERPPQLCRFEPGEPRAG